MLYSIFINIVPFLGVLTIVVFFHEMGHFLVGRLCGVKVDAFSLGFGPELLHYTDRRGTRWRLALLPLGGYVKFHGDANAASVADEQAVATMSDSERSLTLFGQNVWKRAAIVAAGPAANFIVAIVIFTSLYHFNGREMIRPAVGTVMAGSAAAASGFKPNDLILSVDGQTIDSFDDIKPILQSVDAGPISFAIQRDGQEMTLLATPKSVETNTLFGALRERILGVTPASLEIHLRRYDLVDAFKLGVSKTWFIVTSTGHYLKGLLAGRESTDQLSGPIRIAKVSGVVAQAGIAPLIEFVAIISISIGLLNLLPIPLLDGGFLLFFGYEAIRGKALDERVQQVGFRIGLTFIAALTIFVAYNDLSRPSKRPATASQAPIATDKK